MIRMIKAIVRWIERTPEDYAKKKRKGETTAGLTALVIGIFRRG